MTDSNGHRPAVDPPLHVPLDTSSALNPATIESDEAAQQMDPSTPAGIDRVDVRSYVSPDPVVQFSDRATRTPEQRSAARHRRVKRYRRSRIAGSILLGAAVLILVASGWVAWRSYQAYSHLQSASGEVSTLQKQITDITAAGNTSSDITSTDRVATTATIQRLQDQSAAARSAVDDPVFRAATLLPFLGPNLDALRKVTVTVDSLATDVMPSLVDIAQTLQPQQLAPVDGAIDLAPIEKISPLLQHADDAVNQARLTMAGIDRSAVLAPMGTAVVTLWRKLDEAAAVTEPGARIARLLPDMLGADGPRTYLVAFQNPAEPRATGGMFGSFAVITVDNGKITIVDQGAASRTLGQFDPPVAQLSAKEINLYSAKVGQFPQDVNLSPDFPAAARVFAEMYRQHSGTTVDGVLAIDPVALSYMLKGNPPIDVGDGVSITSDNLVPVLLSTAYAKFTEAGQGERDAFLARATGKVFQEVMSGHGSPRSILDGLRKATDERRVLIYSADPVEQADIAPTGLSGSLDQQTTVPSIGVFLNDVTAAKLGYYLHNEVHVTGGDCRTDGRRELSVRVVMHYDAPSSGLPSYVLGATDPGRAYLLKTNVMVFAPAGGGVVSDTAQDGNPIPIGRGEDHAREVGSTTVTLAPGASTELTFTVLGPATVDGGADSVQPNLLLTPGVTPWVTSVDPYPDCRAPAA